MNNNYLCIVQARCGSTRLPGKILMSVNGVSMLEYEICRIRKSEKINKIVIATTVNKIDDSVEILCKELGIDCFRGSEDDVLDRYYQCALKYPSYKNIIRLTGDCPLIDPKVIDDVIGLFERGDYDYTSNYFEIKGNDKSEHKNFPDGLDVEIFKRSVLEIAHNNAKLLSEREHVTPYIRKNEGFKKGFFSAKEDYSHFRLTLDNKEDFEVIEFLIKNSEKDDDYLAYISLLERNPEVMKKNMSIIRNEGFLKSLKNDVKVK